jgi:hypothetical protein
MLFNLLKLFGLDVRAEFAAVKGEIERRIDATAARARRTAIAAAVIAVLATLASLFAITAIGVGLFALYRLEEAAYGPNVSLGILAAVLVVAILILLGAAWMVARSLSGPAETKIATDPAGSSATPQAAAAAASPAPVSGDLVEPLTFLLGLLARDRKFGHPAVDEFVATLRTPAGGKVDDAVGQALNLVRHGDRTQLAIILSAAMATGWLLARSRPEPPPGDSPGAG